MKMGRDPNIKTVGGTSIPKIVSDLLDYEINTNYKQASLTERRKKSRAEIVEESVQLLSYINGNLQKFLLSKNFPKEVVENIISRLKEEYGPLVKDKF